jgi:hypothetical protein
MGVGALREHEEDAGDGKGSTVPGRPVTVLVSDELADPHFVGPEYVSRS